MAEVQDFASRKNIQLNLDDNPETKILIVADEGDFAEYLKKFVLETLENVGVRLSFDSFDAGYQLNKFSPDIVMLDLMMKSADGLKICRQIRQDPTHKNVKIITLSENSSPEMQKLISQIGVYGCLGNPLNVDCLHKLIA